MDYNTSTHHATTTTNAASPPQQRHQASTPTAVILARNIQKFFQNKSDMLSGKQQHSSDLDVPAVLKDVDEILESRTVEDGRLLLRGMVADLLREVDLLRFRLDETTANLAAVKEERDVVNNDYRDRLFSLVLALQQKQSTNDDDDETTAEMKQRMQDGKLLTADEATILTIKALTTKVETLNVEHTRQKEQLAASRERMEDLESENEAKTHKIAALEKQFCSINQKRHKVVLAKLQSNNNSKLMVHSQKENKNVVFTSSPFHLTDNNNKVVVAKPLPFESVVGDNNKVVNKPPSPLESVGNNNKFAKPSPFQLLTAENNKVVVTPTKAAEKSNAAGGAVHKPKAVRATRLVKLVDQM